MTVFKLSSVCLYLPQVRLLSSFSLLILYVVLSILKQNKKAFIYLLWPLSFHKSHKQSINTAIAYWSLLFFIKNIKNLYDPPAIGVLWPWDEIFIMSFMSITTYRYIFLLLTESADVVGPWYNQWFPVNPSHVMSASRAH